eukprot:15420880-Heterocapsa_arctica.AAC.1
MPDLIANRFEHLRSIVDIMIWVSLTATNLRSLGIRRESARRGVRLLVCAVHAPVRCDLGGQ